MSDYINNNLENYSINVRKLFKKAKINESLAYLLFAWDDSIFDK